MLTWFMCSYYFRDSDPGVRLSLRGCCRLLERLLVHRGCAWYVILRTLSLTIGIYAITNTLSFSL